MAVGTHAKLMILLLTFWYAGLFGVYFSLKYLSLSDATVLTFLAPVLVGKFPSITLRNSTDEIL